MREKREVRETRHNVQQTMEVIEEPGNNNSGNAVNNDDNNDEVMDIVPPLVLSLAHSARALG
jgi:hypothetical protein